MFMFLLLLFLLRFDSRESCGKFIVVVVVVLIVIVIVIVLHSRKHSSFDGGSRAVLG